MEEERKKILITGITVVCLLSAIVIWWSSRPSKTGPESIPGSTWVKCENPDCKAEYEMPMAKYAGERQKLMLTSPPGDPRIKCEKCGKLTLRPAVKCPHCGTVFFENSVRGDLPDKCPKCGYSQTEETRKQNPETS